MIDLLPYLSTQVVVAIRSGYSSRRQGTCDGKSTIHPRKHVGLGFEPHWRLQPAKLPSCGGYSLDNLQHTTTQVVADMFQWPG